MTTDCRALCAELYAIFEKYDDESNLAGIYSDMEADGNDLLTRARVALGIAPTPMSLKKQAQARLDRLIALIPTEGALLMAEPIRRALEALPND